MLENTIRQTHMMCCRMLNSRACNMAGAYGFESCRPEKERCRH